MAIKCALLSLCKRIDKVHICIRSDNSSALSYINNQGGSIMSLFKSTKEMFPWCDERNIVITAIHTAGKITLLQIICQGHSVIQQNGN